MAIDPVRPLRTLYLQQLLGTLRRSRESILMNIRPIVIAPGPLDLEELERAIERSLNYHLQVKGKALIEMFVKLGYERGVDYTVGQVQAQAPIYETKLVAGVDWTRPDMAAIDELAKLSLADLKGINADLGRKVMRTIIDADKQGLGITRISRDITEQFNSIGLPRAEMIARTSINQAYNRAAWERIRKYAPYKIWIATVPSERTRDSHKEMHHKIVPVEEPFEVPSFKPTPGSKTVPGCKMMYPGDVTFQPDLAQVINCRCTIGPKFKGPEEPATKQKKKTTKKKEMN